MHQLPSLPTTEPGHSGIVDFAGVRAIMPATRPDSPLYRLYTFHSAPIEAWLRNKCTV